MTLTHTTYKVETKCEWYPWKEQKQREICIGCMWMLYCRMPKLQQLHHFYGPECNYKWHKISVSARGQSSFSTFVLLSLTFLHVRQKDKSSFTSMTRHGKDKVSLSDYIVADNKRNNKMQSATSVWQVILNYKCNKVSLEADNKFM